jgi:hypothetical protein
MIRTKALPRKRVTPRSRRCQACQARYVGLKCPVCATRSSTKRGNIGKRCDALWSQIIKAPGKCFRCGTTEGLQAAHIIGRAQRVVRWSVMPPNGICLCHSCHRLFDTHRIDRQALIHAAIGFREHERLTDYAQGVWSKRYPLEALKARLKELKEAKS